MFDDGDGRSGGWSGVLEARKVTAKDMVELWLVYGSGMVSIWLVYGGWLVCGECIW